MNPQDQEVLDNILKQNPEDLNPVNRAILNARRDYLTNDQKRIFASVLAHEQEVQKEELVEEERQGEIYVSKADREAQAKQS